MQSKLLLFLYQLYPQVLIVILPLKWRVLTVSLSFYLNSEDVHEMDLPVQRWHHGDLEQLAVIPYQSAPHLVTQFCVRSALPVSPPNIFPPVHTGVYLPTAGRDGEWLNGLVELELHIIKTREKF